MTNNILKKVTEKIFVLKKCRGFQKRAYSKDNYKYLRDCYGILRFIVDNTVKISQIKVDCDQN